MKPGDVLFIEGHAFRFETEQDDGWTLFLKAEETGARAFAEQAKSIGLWFPVEGEYRATEGRITALREGVTGALRVRLELRETGDAVLLWPRAG